MDLVVVITVFGGLVITLIFGRTAYLRGIQIQEDAKTMRSRANALERSNQSRTQGLFEYQIAKLANQTNPEGSELVELVNAFAPVLMKKNENARADVPGQPPSTISWEVMREQLRNPEVKKVILENKVEALQILQS